MGKKKPRPEPFELGLPLAGIDSHAHLDMDQALVQDLGGVLDRARRSGVAAIGNVFLGPAAFAANVRLFDARPEVFFILGLHPSDVGDAAPDDLIRMERAFAAEPRLRALGEIGLDFYWDASPRELQRRFFADQLSLAKSLEKPVVIHSRDAHAETLALLDDLGMRGRAVLWHCFGGDAHLARELLRRGFYISIPGPVTYAKNTALAEAARIIPLDRLLIESDCPFLTPEPYRGRRNEPALTVFTCAALARIKDLEAAKLWRITGENARRFFGLDGEAAAGL